MQEKASIQTKVIAPHWSEFCPEQYVNARHKYLSDIDFEAMHTMPYCKSKKKWVKTVNAITILPALDCWGATAIRRGMAANEIASFNQNLNYWNKRKTLFDSAVATCASAPIEQQAGCYMQVRQIELQRQQIAVQNMQAQIQNINAVNQSIQMQNMNYNLNNINNNLNRRYGY